MNKLKSLSILFVLLISSGSAIAQTFNITGTTSGIADGTWLYLRTSKPEKTLDSTKVLDNKFSLKGKTDEKISRMMLYTSKYKNYVSFWAEENTRLELKNGSFKKGIITGSKTQIENEQLSKMQLPLQKEEDSLNNLYENEKVDSVKKGLLVKIRKIRAAVSDVDMNYIKNHPGSLVSVYILDIYAAGWGKEKASLLYQNLNPEIKETSFGKNVYEFIRLNKNIKIGEHFVDFEETNTAGKNMRLSAIKGKYILLEFWASWCGPCREENPALVSTYNLFKDKGFSILGVSADDNKALWLKAVKDDKLAWENVSDLKGDKNKAALIYGITAYPTNFLIDEQGTIIAKNLRGDALKEKLTALLNKRGAL